MYGVVALFRITVCQPAANDVRSVIVRLHSQRDLAGYP